MNAMNDIMSADDAVDALPDMGVMDCYVRSKLMKAAMDKYRNHPNGWDAEGYKSAKNALMHYSPDGVRCHYASSRDASGWLKDVSVNNRSEDWVIAVYDAITNDDWSREKCISVSRDYLKDYLSGSMGMPDDKVIRDTMKNYDA